MRSGSTARSPLLLLQVAPPRRCRRPVHDLYRRSPDSGLSPLCGRPYRSSHDDDSHSLHDRHDRLGLDGPRDRLRAPAWRRRARPHRPARRRRLRHAPRRRPHRVPWCRPSSAAAGRRTPRWARSSASSARYDPATAVTLSMHSHLVAAQVWRHHHGMDAETVFRKVVDDGAILVSTGASDWVGSNGTAERGRRWLPGRAPARGRRAAARSATCW